MAYRNELAVEKLLVWITEIPFEDKPRRSSNFSLMGSEWYLLFSYKVYSSISCRYHALSLHRVIVGDEPPQQIEFKARTYVTNPAEPWDGEREAMTETIQQPETTLWFPGEGCFREDIFKTLPSLYASGEIKFVCKFYDQPQSALQLEVNSQGTSTTSGTVPTAEPSDLECLSLDLGRLLEGEQLPDVRLNCGGQTFHAHRSVLAARSEVFAAMFGNKMAKSETGGVDVKDFGPDVVRHFLQYVYSGKLTADSGDAVASLYAIADKYAVDSLKSACTRWIVDNLTEENCIQYLTVADLHGSEALKKEVVAFVCDRPEVMLGEEWAELSKKNPKLALEVHQSFVRSKTKA